LEDDPTLFGLPPAGGSIGMSSIAGVPISSGGKAEIGLYKITEKGIQTFNGDGWIGMTVFILDKAIAMDGLYSDAPLEDADIGMIVVNLAETSETEFKPSLPLFQ
jgi:hypothetical protein